MSDPGSRKRLFIAIQLWIGKLRGGLALTSISMCGVFSACSGVVGAVETVVGMMAIPPMVKQKYKHDLISGTICAGGSLGTIIPPTVVVIVYGSIVEQSIGDLFAGVVIPGLIMTVLFLGYIIIRCYLRPEDAPAVQTDEHDKISLGQKLSVTMSAIVPALVLVIAVLGSILAGIASPTEAAAVGALGAILLIFAYGQMSFEVVKDVLTRAIKINAMVMFAVMGGVMFSSIFLVNGGNDLIREFLATFDPSKTQLIILMLGVIFLLGFNPGLGRDRADLHADLYTANPRRRDRPDLVRHHGLRCHSDIVPYATGSTVDLLPARYCTARDKTCLDVQGGYSLYHLSVGGLVHCGNVSADSIVAARTDIRQLGRHQKPREQA